MGDLGMREGWEVRCAKRAWPENRELQKSRLTATDQNVKQWDSVIRVNNEWMWRKLTRTLEELAGGDA